MNIPVIERCSKSNRYTSQTLPTWSVNEPQAPDGNQASSQWVGRLCSERTPEPACFYPWEGYNGCLILQYESP